MGEFCTKQKWKFWGYIGMSITFPLMGILGKVHQWGGMALGVVYFICMAAIHEL